MKIVKQGFYIHDLVQQTKVEISTSSRFKRNFLISIIIFIASVILTNQGRLYTLWMSGF